MSYLGMILLSLYMVFAWILGGIYLVMPALALENLTAERRLLSIVAGILMPMLLPVWLIWVYIRKRMKRSV